MLSSIDPSKSDMVVAGKWFVERSVTRELGGGLRRLRHMFVYIPFHRIRRLTCWRIMSV